MKRLCPLYFILFPFAFLMTCAPSFAEPSRQAGHPPPPVPARGGDAIELDRITVTATKTEESVVDTMAGTSVVTRGQVDQRLPSSIGQMIQSVPGVWSQVTANDPGQSINIRGLQDYGRVNVLVDGARQDYQISGHNANGTFYVDPEFIGQVDVLRGPVSNIYGSGAIGGVASFRTRDISDILKPDERYGLEQRIVAGSNGAGFVTSSSVGARAGQAADAFGQLTYRNQSAYRDGSGTIVPETGQRMVGGLFKLNVRPSDAQRISLSLLQQNNQFTNTNSLESGAGARFKQSVDTGTYTLGYTLKSPEAPLVDFGIKLYYSGAADHQTFVAPDARNLYTALGVTGGDGLSDKIDTGGFDVHNTSRFTTGALAHALTVGGDGVIDRVHTYDAAGGFVSVLTPSGRRGLAGGFVQDEVSFASRLRVLGAVRYDHYALSGGGTDANGSHLSPKLTIGVTPLRGIEFYGTYAEGYRAPSITEALIQGVHPFPAFTFLPNSSLKPEIARNYEVGVNIKYNDIWRHGDLLRAKATAFTNDVANYIDLAQVGAPLPTSFVPGFPNAACASAPPGMCIPFQPYQYVNLAKARIKGVELEGAYDWGGGFVSFSGTLTNGKNLTAGSSLVTVAPNRAMATLALRFLEDRSLTLGTRLTAVDASARNIPTSSWIKPSRGYVLADLFGSYRYSDQVSADLSLTNLFNRQYTQFLESEPSPGLTVKAGLTVRFAAK